MAVDKSYFSKVVAVTENYLGPAAERFIRRQSEFHLNKEAEKLTKADIPKLTSSVSVALGLLINDRSIVSSAAEELSKIK